MYGWFHLMFFGLSILLGVLLCIIFKNPDYKTVKRLNLFVAIIVILLEIYKQINYSFYIEGGKIIFDYQWYAFPFQFCSTPMYVGLLAGLVKKGKVHDALCAFLATFSVFAGVCVMFYPAQVFIDTVGINIQTMICHGSMITVGIFLLGSGYVKLKHSTILKAASVFACAVGIAVILNEIAYRTNFPKGETFNMFYISPYFEPSLPVYSTVQELVKFPWCLIIYIVAFSLASYIILLLAMLVNKMAKKEKKTV